MMPAPDDAAPPGPLDPPAAGEGFQMRMDAVAPAGTELWRCVVAPLTLPAGSASSVYVNTVHSTLTVGTHHFFLSFISPLSSVTVPNGTYDCANLYAQYPDLMASEIELYGGQLPDAYIHLPTGVAAQVLNGLTSIYELHYVNASDTDKAVFSTINAYTIPQSQVTGTVWTQLIPHPHIAIPPSSYQSVWTRCVFNKPIEALILTSHSHKLATRFHISFFDGASVGQQLYENTNWQGPPLVTLDPPIQIAAGQGFEFGCDYFNPSNQTVHDGYTSSDEMCHMFVTYTPFDPSITCTTVQSSDGILPTSPQ
jgi:hypothetical protein